MSEKPTFGQLLRQHRLDRRLTQVELACLAGLSEWTVVNVETGKTRPRGATAGLLADALQLTETERGQFLAAARGSVSPQSRRACPRHNLPAALTHFVGREEEQAELVRLLRGPVRRRLVTLTGLGGVGKTRLALQVAEALLPQYLDGVWLVELAAVAEPDLVPATVAAVLGVPEQLGQEPREALLAWVRARRLLLLLDNCEHLVDACADLAWQLLQSAREMQVLATSREPLRLAGEAVRRVRPLPVPSPSASLTAATVRDVAAAQLLVERADLVHPGFAVTDANAANVARLCARLDGLPLALELAAAHLATRTLVQIESQLDEAIRRLPSRQRHPLPRHRTLAATLDWSYDLLTLGERAFFRRLAVFAGGWDRAAASAVASDPAPGTACLDALVGKSLVVAEDGAPRYRLLETVRQYARERLVDSGEAPDASARHCAWYTACAERLASPLDGGPEGAAALAWMAREQDNIRAALAWGQAHAPAEGLRLASAVWPYWFIHRGEEEGRAWLSVLLDRVPTTDPSRARGLYALGYLTLRHDVPAVHALLEEALALATAWDQPDLALAIRWPLAYACLLTRAVAEAEAHLAAGRAPAEASAKPGVRGMYHLLQGYLLLQQGDLAAGERMLALALAETRQAKQSLFQCMALAWLGEARLKGGHPDGAAMAYTELLRTAEKLDSHFYQLVARQRLGMVKEWAGDFTAAAAAYAANLTLVEQTGGHRLERAHSLLGLGRVALARREYPQALGLLRQSAQLSTGLHDALLARALSYPLGLACWYTGQRQEAVSLLTEALTLCEQSHDWPGLATCLEGVAGLAVTVGDVALAVQWLTAAEALRQDRRVPRPPGEQAGVALLLEEVEHTLGAPALAVARASSQSQPLAQVVARATAWLRAR